MPELIEKQETEILNNIVEFDKYEVQLVEFEDKFKGMIYDFDDEKQSEQAKLNHKEVRKAYNGLEAIRKATIKEARVVVDTANSKAKGVKDRFDIITNDITAQREAHEKKAIMEGFRLHAMVEEITSYTVFEDINDLTIDLIKERLSTVNNIVVDSSFEEREADGHMAKAKAIELLEGKIALFEKREAEAVQAEKDRVKAQEAREEQIRIDAAANAEKEKEAALLVAEKAKKDKELAQKQAAANEIAVKAKAKKDAEDAKKKAEADKKAAVKAEQERLKAISDKEAAEKAKKESNTKHRAVIHGAIKDSLITSGLVSDEAHAVKIVKFLIDSDKVSINY